MNINIHEKVILTDADGVLLDWVYSFDTWMKRHQFELTNINAYNISARYKDVPDGYRMAKIFNESSWIRKLPPYKNAIKYIRKLHEEHGYIFHVISSLSDDEYSQHLRTKNLRELFGDTPIEKFIYLDTGAEKNEALEFYRDSGCWWIEDNVQNANIGKNMGLSSILMESFHNISTNYFRVPIAKDWEDVYNYITGNKPYV